MEFKGIIIPGEGKAGGYYHVPTANLKPEKEPDLAQGIYVAYGIIEGEKFPAVVCMGHKFEIHLLNWSGNLYNKELVVEIIELISPFVPFTSEEQMKKKIFDDLEKAKTFFHLQG